MFGRIRRWHAKLIMCVSFQIYKHSNINLLRICPKSHSSSAAVTFVQSLKVYVTVHVCFHNVSCNSIDWLMWVSVTRALTACCLIFDLCSDALQELFCGAGVNLWMILSALHLNNRVFATSRKQMLKENWTDKVFSSE